MKRTIWIILLGMGLAAFARGQSLPELLQVAAENNPELRAYFKEYEASLERVPQMGGLPDPELSMGFFLRPMELPMGLQRGELQLMQMFPWFGMLKTKKDEASKMALTRYELFQEAKNRLFLEVKTAWYDLYKLEEEISVSEENLEILERFERLALVRFQSSGAGSGQGSMQQPMSGTGTQITSRAGSSGMGAGMNMGGGKGTTAPTAMNSASPSMNTASSGMSDVLRVRMEIKELENRLALLHDSRAPLMARINSLLNRDQAVPIAVSDSLEEVALSVERLSLLDSITANNPMLKMLDAEKEAYGARRQMAKLEGRPMFGAGVNYMPFSPRTENGMQMGGDDMVMPMVKVTLPIYRKKYRAQLREAELSQEMVELRKESTTNQLAYEWAAYLRDLDDAFRRAKLYKDQTGLARQTLDLLMVAYTSEGRDFEELLRVQQQLLDYRLKLISAVVDQHKVVSGLEALASIELY
ncbi:TolC family protein [Negadavirga shengliensis]|uniref:TolC family protein n=1 Tax=Negadavirga shengliensis TaxID=1389218 RepID=A0ABV9T2G8_9BACT